MTIHTIFYSWQTDSANATNRGFIEQALNQAVKAIRNDSSIHVEPVVDRDTLGLPGSPDIATAIFSKIDKADVFLCDVSIINPASGSRPTPNPNVLVELGYALKALESPQIIMMFNMASGKPEELPFDLRGKRLISYYVTKDVEDKASVRKDVAKKIEMALRSIFTDTELERRGIRKAFERESIPAQRFVIEQPIYWEFLLTAELLKTKFIRIKQQLTDINKGLVYRQTRRMSTSQFTNWASERMHDLERLVDFLRIVIDNEISAAWGAPGQPGDPLAIQHAVDNIISACDGFLEWETELRSISPPERFVKAKELMYGFTSEILAEIESMPGQLITTFEQPNISGVIELPLTFRLPDNSALMEELARLKAYAEEHGFDD